MIAHKCKEKVFEIQHTSQEFMLNKTDWIKEDSHVIIHISN